MSELFNGRVWRDHIERSPAGQMAMDEAILRNSILKSDDSVDLRFYLLPDESVSLGFFMPFDEVSSFRKHADKLSKVPQAIVRRLTGGGIVFHGNDVTFSLCVGKEHRLSSTATVDRYRLVHEALRDSLVQSDVYPEAELVPISANDAEKGALSCFSKPVGWDILERKGGEKIAGGAQRRSSGAWLHQGTVQIPVRRSISAEWTQIFAERLGVATPGGGSPALEAAASDLEKSRYATSDWNERI